MKDRLKHFLSDKIISHDSEVFDYIEELHGYLWRMVRVAFPGANGLLSNFLDRAIEELEATQQSRTGEMTYVWICLCGTSNSTFTEQCCGCEKLRPYAIPQDC